jgi:hypothetical protein
MYRNSYGLDKCSSIPSTGRDISVSQIVQVCYGGRQQEHEALSPGKKDWNTKLATQLFLMSM